MGWICPWSRVFRLSIGSCDPLELFYGDVMKKINIHIGQLYASKEPVVIQTLLGSCVAVCLYDPLLCIGGMNHILLPGRADLRHFDTVSRYGINAMELLINRVMTLGGNRHNLIAKVFGGAHILPAISPENGVGGKNIEFVLDFLQMEAITIVSQDLGGHDTRKIFFHTDTGEVFLKRIPCTHNHRISVEERRLMDLVRRKAEESGDITLFS
jgi:chemotaxis protein CheD